MIIDMQAGMLQNDSPPRDVYGFPRRPAQLRPCRCFRVDCLPDLVELPRHATHAFMNVDGAYWVVICDDAEELATIARSWPDSEYSAVEILPE